MKMINCKKSLIIWIAGALVCGTLSAQEGDFDLSSQRSESQYVLPVPGKKLDHQGIIINPTPQRLVFHKESTLNISEGVCLKDRQDKFSNDLGFVSFNKKGAKLSIDFGTKVALKRGAKAISGSYVMSIDDKWISITGYYEKVAFCWIQTLIQLIEIPATAGRKLPYL